MEEKNNTNIWVFVAIGVLSIILTIILFSSNKKEKDKKPSSPENFVSNSISNEEENKKDNETENNSVNTNTTNTAENNVVENNIPTDNTTNNNTNTTGEWDEFLKNDGEEMFGGSSEVSSGSGDGETLTTENPENDPNAGENLEPTQPENP